MDVFRRCGNCKRRFKIRPQSPSQRFCSRDECQRARRRIWQRERLQSDLDYRENQLRASADWRARNPDYWKVYRRKHPDYVAHNREHQKERRAKVSTSAKMDVSSRVSPLYSGTYVLTAIATRSRAKMNTWIVDLTVLRATAGQFTETLQIDDSCRHV